MGNVRVMLERLSPSVVPELKSCQQARRTNAADQSLVDELKTEEPRRLRGRQPAAALEAARDEEEEVIVPQDNCRELEETSNNEHWPVTSLPPADEDGIVLRDPSQLQDYNYRYRQFLVEVTEIQIL